MAALLSILAWSALGVCALIAAIAAYGWLLIWLDRREWRWPR